MCANTFVHKNFQTSIDRMGLRRNAIVIIFSMVVHVVDAFYVFLGPDDFNGDLYVRLHWTGSAALAKFDDMEFSVQFPTYLSRYAR